MSLMSVGRLFQTSGPLTENARRPNCVLVRRTDSPGKASILHISSCVLAVDGAAACDRAISALIIIFIHWN